jgi:hypothetical protein
VMSMQRGTDQSGSEGARAARSRASLERLIGAPMSIGEFLSLAVRLADEVAALHARGVIYQMLEPANIQVDARTGAVAISSSRSAPGDDARWIHGSLPYMSPEQTGRTDRPIDSRSDLYSLGVTFFQLLGGRRPFEADDVVGWVHSHVARKPPPLDELLPSVPHVLADIVGKLLAKVPDDRYQSALGLRHDLARCLREWREGGRIAAFPLAEGEVHDQFRIPHKLYGRTAESAELREALDRVAEIGAPELVLISGSAGIGKSTVVRELRGAATRRGRFIAGKCEQYKRDIPYLPIRQAFRELALDLLAESDATIVAWRERPCPSSRWPRPRPRCARAFTRCSRRAADPVIRSRCSSTICSGRTRRACSSWRACWTPTPTTC